MEILLAFIGVIIAIISGWYTYRSYKHSREVASKEAGLNIGLYSSDTHKNIFILLPFNEKKMFLIPFIFSIYNSGVVSAKDVEVFITVTSQMYPSGVKRRLSNIAVARGIKHASEEGRTEHLTDSYIKIGDIPPKATFNLSDEFSWNTETIIRRPVEATSKDGVNFTAHVIMAFALALEVKILHQDNQPITKKYSIEFRKFYENEKLKDFVKREEELLHELHKGPIQIDQIGQDPKRIRFVTFGDYKDVEDPAKARKGKDKRNKFLFVRCNENSIRYVDGTIEGDKLIFEKQSNA